MSALVSVIVPVYGVESYLHQCLDSVIGQTYEELDVVLVDDGSLDACGSICDEYASKDSRVRVFHTSNRGLSAARNRGIREARGEYIIFLDGDDWLELDTVRTLVDAVHDINADIICCRHMIDWAKSSEAPHGSESTVILKGDEALRGLLVNGQVGDQAWGKLYRANLFLSVSYPDGHVFEDIATTHRVVMGARSVACIPDVLFHYCVRSGSISKLHSASNLVDYWRAYLQRYEDLGGLGSDFRAISVRGCLGSITRTWCWWITCSSAERESYRKDILAMRSFARMHTHEVLHGNYPTGTKVRCIAGRYTSSVIWTMMYVLNRLRHVVIRRKGLYP